jgi:hypothetical protein
MIRAIKLFYYFLLLCWLYAFIDVFFLSPNINEFYVMGSIKTSKPIASLIYFLLVIIAIISIRETNREEKGRKQ